MNINPEKIKKLKVVKVLQTGGKSKYVKLLKQQVIKKAYDKTVKKQRYRFEKEVEYLTHLEHCPFVPKILAINRKNLVIFMTYVGKPLPKTPQNRTRLTQTMKSLHQDWNLLRHRNGITNYQINMNNATIKNDQIHIIDFGSPHYKIVGPKIIPKLPNTPKPNAQT